MYFSIIIPTRDLSHYLLEECLPAIAKLNYHNFEVIVLPNNISKTDELLKKKYLWLKIIPTNKITRPAEKRDIGAKHAKGEILAFIDDDAYPDKNWLTNASNTFNNSSPYPICKGLTQQSKNNKNEIVAICGPGILPKKINIWEKIFDEILKSWIGSGGYDYRFTQKNSRYVDDYPSMNFLVKKKIFRRLGGFNNNFWPGEDSKLCEDIVYEESALILYDPNILVYHHRRNNLKAFLEQHANYGFHRGAFFAHGDRNSQRISYLIPTFFIFYLLFTIIYTLFFTNIYYLISIIYWPLIIYLILMLFLSLRSLLNTKNLIISFLSPFTLLLTHLTYGIMFIKGFIIGLIKKEKIYIS